MAFNRPIVVALVALWSTLAAAQQDDWRKYVVAETGATVDVPSSIFSKAAGKPETGYGTRFLTADGRANLTVQSVPNDADETPAAFLGRKHPPQRYRLSKGDPEFLCRLEFS
jgi:hypothetical protein